MKLLQFEETKRPGPQHYVKTKSLKVQWKQKLFDYEFLAARRLCLALTSLASGLCTAGILMYQMATQLELNEHVSQPRRESNVIMKEYP